MTEAKTDEAKESARAQRRLAQTLGKFIALLLVVLLVILFERYCTPEAPPFGPDAKIVSIDGDTLRAGDGAEYRLFGIDAPELKQTCKEADGKDWLCGRAAKARLTTILKRGNVTCEPRGKDEFGRILAICSAEGMPDIGETLVRDGYAVAIGVAGASYAEAEAEARSARRGIWRGSLERPSEWRAANPRLE